MPTTKPKKKKEELNLNKADKSYRSGSNKEMVLAQDLQIVRNVKTDNKWCYIAKTKLQSPYMEYSTWNTNYTSDPMYHQPLFSSKF